MEGIQNQRKKDQEEIDNTALVVGLYNQDSCILVANFISINLPTGCTVDVRAYALIPSYNAPIPRVQKCYCNVYTQGRNTLTYIH